jgi:acyl-CoA thioester hydrolase
MITSETRIRVRYGEVDRMGYLHHSTYALYFEQGRTDLIRNLGMSYREIEDRGILMPVREIHIRYFLPAKYDEEVIVTTRLAKRPDVRLEFEYKVHNLTGDLLCEAGTTLVFTDSITRKPIRMPGFFRLLIGHYFD